MLYKSLKNFILTFSASLALWSCSKDNVTIHLIGDSTMADYEENSTQIRGWGEMLCQFVPDGVRVRDCAIPGRSSKSFYEEGSWNKVKDSLTVGDYVLIQFAHNDEKDNGEEGPSGRGTAPWTSYKNYLSRYIDEARQAGAKPILVQPIVRRYFDGANITARGRHNLSSNPTDTTLDYTAVMRRLSIEKDVPLIDLCEKSREIVEAYGERDSKEQLYVNADNTHTQAKGAIIYAIVANCKLGDLKVWHGHPHKPKLVVNPRRMDYGEVFIGDTLWQCFDAVCLDGLDIEEKRYLTGIGQLTVKAPAGWKLSHTLGGEVKDTLCMSATKGVAFFACCTPKAEGTTNGTIYLGSHTCHAEIPVKCVGRKVKSQEDAFIHWDNIHEKAVSKNLDAKLSIVKGLTSANGHFGMESGLWQAEIDEDGNRFVQLKIVAGKKDVRINKLSLGVSPEMCYRISYAYGNDFFLRSTVGERQNPSADGLAVDSYSTSVKVKAGEMVLFRIYPWSKQARKNFEFDIVNVNIEGTAIE